jgi:hypothetical protein
MLLLLSNFTDSSIHTVSNALETLLKREKLLKRLSFGRLAAGHHRL